MGPTTVLPLIREVRMPWLNTPLLALQAELEMGPGAIVYLLVLLALVVLFVAAGWKVFTKAGQPGWASIVPIYNFWVMLKIVGRPGWWIVLMLIPFVNIFVGIIVLVDIAKSFGHGVGFALGLIFLGPIFWLILGFGSSTYRGPSAALPAVA